jgi:hypothetical protein
MVRKWEGYRWLHSHAKFCIFQLDSSRLEAMCEKIFRQLWVKKERIDEKSEM